MVSHRDCPAGDIRVGLIDAESQESRRAERGVCLRAAKSVVRPLPLTSAVFQILRAYHVNVVIVGFRPIPHPLEQACLSIQLPARPQSVAAITVVGQKPQSPCSVSTRQLNPESAVRDLEGSPSKNPQVVRAVWMALAGFSLVIVAACPTPTQTRRSTAVAGKDVRTIIVPVEKQRKSRWGKSRPGGQSKA